MSIQSSSSYIQIKNGSFWDNFVRKMISPKASTAHLYEVMRDQNGSLISVKQPVTQKISKLETLLKLSCSFFIYPFLSFFGVVTKVKNENARICKTSAKHLQDNDLSEKDNNIQKVFSREIRDKTSNTDKYQQSVRDVEAAIDNNDLGKAKKLTYAIDDAADHEAKKIKNHCFGLVVSAIINQKGVQIDDEDLQNANDITCLINDPTIKNTSHQLIIEAAIEAAIQKENPEYLELAKETADNSTIDRSQKDDYFARIIEAAIQEENPEYLELAKATAELMSPDIKNDSSISKKDECLEMIVKVAVEKAQIHLAQASVNLIKDEGIKAKLQEIID